MKVRSDSRVVAEPGSAATRTAALGKELWELCTFHYFIISFFDQGAAV